ncbi:MAG: hypothetical protein V5B39_13375 [Accumulibacter sp.]|uniref:hypothetical protein n=1 Tax=Accumulibacter sp. TaxID=2053492 RepID=UPI002FC3677B
MLGHDLDGFAVVQHFETGYCLAAMPEGTAGPIFKVFVCRELEAQQSGGQHGETGPVSGHYGPWVSYRVDLNAHVFGYFHRHSQTRLASKKADRAGWWKQAFLMDVWKSC